jgi:hypothetical protein
VPKRLTVTELVHVIDDGDPFPRTAESRFARPLKSDGGGDVYQQPVLKVGAEWVPVEYGWAGPSPSHLSIKNLEPRPERQPSAAEDAVARAALVVVGLGGPPTPIPCAQIRVGESARFEPIAGVKYCLRCPCGVARVSVMVVPA